jgi:hypothetical protein
MRFRSVRHVYLATMMALAALNALSERIALAQIPEAPGTFVDEDGMSSQPAEVGPRRKNTKTKSGEAAPTPDSARESINDLERASGTPMPEPTPPRRTE